MGEAFSKGLLGMLFQHLKSILGIDDPAKTLDEQYEQVLVDQIAGSDVTKAAILATGRCLRFRWKTGLEFDVIFRAQQVPLRSRETA